MPTYPRSTSRLSKEIAQIKAGLSELDSAQNAAPPAEIRISLGDRVFNRAKVRAIKETNRYNAEQFRRWQKAVGVESGLLRLISVFGAGALIFFGIYSHLWLVGVLSIPWYLLTLVWLSRVARRYQRPEVQEPVLTANGKGAAVGGIGFLGGAVAGAYIGAGVGIVGGPLGAMVGTIPGALIGGILGALGLTEVKHQSEKRREPDTNQRTRGKKGAIAGLLAGAGSGALVGSGLGLAAGPLGAVAGTVPGAIIGGLVGMLSGAKLSR